MGDDVSQAAERRRRELPDGLRKKTGGDMGRKGGKERRKERWGVLYLGGKSVGETSDSSVPTPDKLSFGPCAAAAEDPLSNSHYQLSGNLIPCLFFGTMHFSHTL